MLYAIVVVLLLIADQGLKYWVTVHVALNEGRHVLIPKVLDIMNIHNYGIAFSWLQNVPSWVFAIIAAIFAAVVIVALKRGMIQGRFGRWMAVLALAGAIGNCIDRVLSGYVVDMLAFSFWKSFPVFNLADACLVVGGIAFCLYVIFRKDPEEQSAAPARKRAGKKASAGKPALGAVLAEKSASLRKSADAKLQQAKTAAAQKRADAEHAAAAAPKAEPAAKKPSNDDPFAAWDRAVSEQDARDKAEAERKAKLRAEREAKRAAEAARAKEAAAAQSAPAAEADAKPAAPAKQPAVDDAPTRKVAAQKIEEMAAKLAPKKPEPAAKPEPPKEEEVSYDLEDILREFADL